MSAEMSTKIKGIMIYFDALEEYKHLTKEQFGNLMWAGLVYGKTGEELDLSFPEKYLFPGLKLKIDRDKVRYIDICRKRTESANKRWGNSPDANACESMQMHANDANIIINPDNQSNDKSHTEVIINSNQQQGQIGDRMITSDLIKEGYTQPEIDLVLSRVKDCDQIRDLKSYLKTAIDSERKQKPKVKLNAQQYSQRDYTEQPESMDDVLRSLLLRQKKGE